MRKNYYPLCIFILLATYFVSCSTDKKNISDGALEQGFVAPPDSVRIGVYWYWISDHISEEGVVKDLQAMKKAGITRAFIGNIGLDEMPAGKVKMFSDEWWKILHTTLKTATELGIDIGIFNSPGWSQSGGPWVKPEEAMRYLASSELRVAGPQKLNQKLNQPTEFFQDVKTLAYPVPKELVLDNKSATVTSSPKLSGLNQILDGDKTTGIVFPEGETFTLEFNAKEPFTARSLSVQTTEKSFKANAIFQVKETTGEFRTVSEFEMDRSNSALNVGFEPFAPVVISFPEITSKSFRLIINDYKRKSGLAEVAISSVPRVERYAEKTLAKMYQTPLPYWKEYQWPQQAEPAKSMIVDASKVIDISEFLAEDGTLTWDVPEGDWVILRTGMTPTGVKNSPASPEATGLEIDKMSKKHIKKHFDSFIGEILKRIPEADRKSFKEVVQDSYEMGGQNFTDDFIAEFQERYGYDPVPFLPVYKGFVVNSEESSDRFLWDVRRMVADKVAYDYVGGLRDACHEYGLKTWLENYGHWGFPGEFLMYGGQSDGIGGEFWSEGDLGNIENRAATSCGHIYGKIQISAESNTCGGPAFSRYPAMFKQRGDRFFAEGINNTILHVYVSQPYEDKNPGVNAWFGNEFNRKNTWFSQMDIYTDYLKRTNFMLQQGINVADAAYFIGEDAPKMTGITDPELPVGYQFDYINAEVIEKYMTVEDGLLTLPHGTQYRILVLPKLETMRPELLQKIKQLVNDGAIVLGPDPNRSPSLQNQPEADEQVKQMAEELWGDVDGGKVKAHSFGKGMILNGLTMEEAFDIIRCVPDCKLPENKSIHFGHRKLENTDIYFVSNQTSETQTFSPEFRVDKKQPELWKATDGTMRNLLAFEETANGIKVPLELAPYESVFVVFRKKAQKAEAAGLKVNFPKPTILIEMNGPWTVQYDASMRGPEEPVVFNSLQDWTSSSDEKIKYYSGTAIYSSKFNLNELPADEQFFIDLGKVSVMAKVTVNGTYVGGVWTPPYQIDISKAIKAGENEVKIEVVNTWVNRLIGDQNLPQNERKTWCLDNPYKADSKLQSSGLLGPVIVSCIKY
ncbi:glycoside hydrolase family 2 [Maribellus comscasis]|uniref:Glycoside hydrolase family 2 n=2 Tax=Maribellus comscasis TaxID=2681766 RepID=A0A6I6JIT4_9BACT|nr:glycoside hydrolase family 2 [Maribellus comscasis]